MCLVRECLALKPWLEYKTNIQTVYLKKKKSENLTIKSDIQMNTDIRCPVLKSLLNDKLMRQLSLISVIQV